jgi:trans-aconitate methyltransferase
LPHVSRVAIVGGGLFPRTALILRRLLPDARLVVIDANADHLAQARSFLGDAVEYRHERWNGRQSEAADLVIVPLAFQGDRRRVYERPAAPVVIVHDWLWHRRGTGTRVSWLLCKRLNLVRR